MENKDKIAELFKTKLGHHAEPVDPAMWSKIQAGLKLTSATSSTTAIVKSVGIIKNVAIATGLIVATSAVVWLVMNPSSETNPDRSKSIDYQVKGVETPTTPALTENALPPKDSNTGSESIQTPNQKPTTEFESAEYQAKTSSPIVVPPSNKPNEKLPSAATTNANDDQEIQTYGNTSVKSENQTQVYEDKEIVEKNNNSLLNNSIPNIFTPNSDGKNDIFIIPITDGAKHTTKILNAKGDLVASFDENSEGWNGTILGGMEAANGTYFYVTFVSDSIGNQQQFKGSIYLKR